MRKQFYLLSLFILFLSCTKEEEAPLNFSSDLIELTSIRSHPNGEIEINYNFDCSAIDTIIYSIVWQFPEHDIICSEYSISTKQDLTFNVLISEKNGEQQFEVLKNVGVDTIVGNENYDYRNLFVGNYEMEIYNESWDVTEGDDKVYDTLYKSGSIDRFIGYTAGESLNYLDIKQKVAIYYDDYNKNNDDSRCGTLNYYTEGFIHPMIDLNGSLYYPELEECSGVLEGFIRNDSIVVKYGWHSKWEGFNRTIIGFKIME